MTGQDELDQCLDFLATLRDSSWSREQLEQEFNNMTRCEYIKIMCGDEWKTFVEKRRLVNGETITKTYVVTMPGIEEETKVNE